MTLLVAALQVAAAAVACSPLPLVTTPARTVEPELSATGTSVPDGRSELSPAEDSAPAEESGAAAEDCLLPTVVAPTPPSETPGYAELDQTTGLHVTGRAQIISLDDYVLKVTGKVDQPLSLTYDDLRCMPKIEVHCTLVCPGFFEDEATWAGASLARVLNMAGLEDEASGIKLISADGYSTFVSLSASQAANSLLAYEWEGEPLPVLHGFPVRAVFPDLEGNRWAKWLVEIEVY